MSIFNPRRRRRQTNNRIHSHHNTDILLRQLFYKYLPYLVLLIAFILIIFMFKPLAQQENFKNILSIKVQPIKGEVSIINTAGVKISDLKIKKSVILLSNERLLTAQNSYANLVIDYDNGQIMVLVGPDSVLSIDFLAHILNLKQGVIMVNNETANKLKIDTFRTGSLSLQNKIYLSTKGYGDELALEKGSSLVKIYNFLLKNQNVKNTLVLGIGQRIIVDSSIFDVWNADLAGIKKPFDQDYLTRGLRNLKIKPAGQKTLKPLGSVVQTTKKLSQKGSNILPPSITFPVDNARIFGQQQVIVEGKVNPQARAVYVNGYRLKLYQTGQKNWSFIAAPAVKTAVYGANVIEVQAEDGRGRRTKKTISRFFLSQDVQQKAEGDILSAPIVLKPRVDKNGNFTTGESAVFISGKVPRGTKAVYVNGYRLKLFRPQDRLWRYYAAVEIGTMKTGNNEYEVVAENAAGQRGKKLKINILFTAPDFVKTPLSVGIISGEMDGR